MKQPATINNKASGTVQAVMMVAGLDGGEP